MKLLAAVIFLVSGLPLQAAEVTNLRAAQRHGTILVDITYDVETPYNLMNVSVALSEDSGKRFEVVSEGLTGDWGPRVVPGKDKRIVWEAELSWLGRSSSNLLIQVNAADIPLRFEMVWIRPGKFTMGSPATEWGRRVSEGPQTDVTLSRGYWLGKYEVTQRDWGAVMGNNPSHFNGNVDLPVETVSWDEAIDYCRRLTEQERSTGRLRPDYEYTLPSESQWEYACRAGTTARYSFGWENEIGQYTWYSGNSGGRTHPVG